LPSDLQSSPRGKYMIISAGKDGIFFSNQDGPGTKKAPITDIVTSAGITAGIDLTLALVADDLGEAVAAGAAGLRVAVTERPGNVALPPGHGFAAFDSLGALLAATRG
jgi:methionine salvage enolase-phosphatase E1